MEFEHNKLKEYRYVEKIGNGGQGVVVKVEEKRKKRHYALKILQDKSNIGYFAKEVGALNETRHKNIVSMYEHSLPHEGGEAFILMEYMYYGNILRYLEQNKQV